MKADCKDTQRLIERLECMAQSFEKMSPCPDHDAAKWYRKAIDALEAKDQEIERLKGENGGAAWILEWMLADKYRKPDVPAVIRQAQKHYQTTLAENECLEARGAELEAMVTALKKEMLEAESQTCSTIFGKPYSEWKDMEARVEELEAALREIAEYNEYAPAVDCVFIAKQALGEKDES